MQIQKYRRSIESSTIKQQFISDLSINDQIVHANSQNSSQSGSKFIPKPTLKIKQLLLKNKTRNNRQLISGVWNIQQNIKYIQFLKKYKNILYDAKLRKKEKIYYQMSTIIKSRTPDQCRGHHLKYIKRHTTIEAIVENLSRFIKDNQILAKIITSKHHYILNKKEQNVNFVTAASYEEQKRKSCERAKIKIIIDVQAIKNWQQY